MTSASNAIDYAPPRRSSLDKALRLNRSGWRLILAGLVPLFVWMTFAPLSTAVIAPAVVKVDLNRRPVQHLEGGIVAEVLVRDGQKVKAGDPIIVLGNVRVDADKNRLQYRVGVERATVARLEAEQRLSKDLTLPAELVEAAGQDPRVQAALEKEKALFASRRDTLNSQVTLLSRQRDKVKDEMRAIYAQINQSESSLTLQKQDLASNQKLLKDGFISSMKIVQMEAIVADYAAKLEERRTEFSRADQRLVDTDLKIQAIQSDYGKAANDELKLTAARLTEIEQELRKSQDASARQVVVAPAAGEIIELKFNSRGAVVQPGEPIAEIVPADTKLVIECRVRPEDVTHVRIGQAARIQFSGFKYQAQMKLDGQVFYISGDRLVDKATGQAYYAALIHTAAQSLKKAGDIQLQAGMPAEAYIQGGKVTPLQYLLEPITRVVRHAGRQL